MNREEAAERLSERVERFIGLAATRLPDDVLEKLAECRSKETDPMQKRIYDAYFTNLELAKALDRPCCQDTGMLHFYVTAGAAFPHLAAVEEALRLAVRRATRGVPLRPNSVAFFDERNSGDNTGERTPWIHWEIVPDRDDLEILVYFGGAGCSLPGNARVCKPSDGYGAVVKAVFDTVTDLGLNACPPLIVGVGLGTNAENAALLAKKACLRPLGTHHAHPRGAALEDALLEGLNALGVGAQGLRGKTAVMGVQVESSDRHTANFAVGVSVACYVHRRGVIRFDRDLNWEVSGYRDAAEYMDRAARPGRGTEGGETAWKQN